MGNISPPWVAVVLLHANLLSLALSECKEVLCHDFFFFLIPGGLEVFIQLVVIL